MENPARSSFSQNLGRSCFSQSICVIIFGMRKEPYTVGSYVHTVKRGGRGLPIVRDDMDKWRFLLSLFHQNDTFHSEYWFRDLMDYNLSHTLERPSIWPRREPIVSIRAFTLMPNHFHLLLKEIKDGGISCFMEKVGKTMTHHANNKYHEKGSIFQGPFHSRTVDSDTYLRYVSAYIMVKNVLELYPKGGLAGATKDFESAWGWGINYPYSSLMDYAGKRTSPIIKKELLGEIFETPEEFKNFARDFILGRSTDPDLDEKVTFE